MHTGEGIPHEEEQIPSSRRVQAKILIGSALAHTVGLAAILQLQKAEGGLKEIPINLNEPFEVVSLEGDDVTLRQNGIKNSVESYKLPEEVIKKIIKQRPELESFLRKGAIYVNNNKDPQGGK